jgi:hypothetical protein
MLEADQTSAETQNVAQAEETPQKENLIPTPTERLGIIVFP